ncbi:hypothetical protein, partial [Saccharicrinis sp. 156]|uniref:hypothetical protein n=1 Tax=Saccharicrinis sp. 156 TaxID=3417574 RepID=UPI003D354FC7
LTIFGYPNPRGVNMTVGGVNITVISRRLICEVILKILGINYKFIPLKARVAKIVFLRLM